MAPDAFWSQKVSWGADYDMIAIGDSRVFMGISPKAMTRVFPKQRIANFGFSSCGLGQAYLNRSEQLLDPESKKKIILLAISAGSLSQTAVDENGYLEYSNKSAFELWKYKNLGKFLYFFDPYTEANFFNFFRDTQWRYLHNYKSTGWVASTREPEDPNYAYPSYKRHVERHGSKAYVSEAVLSGVLAKVEEWASQGIEVYGHRMPIESNLENLENTVMQFNEASVIERFEAAGGVWIELGEEYYSYDGSHLRRDAAEQYSVDLALAIKKAQSL